MAGAARCAAVLLGAPTNRGAASGPGRSAPVGFKESQLAIYMADFEILS